MGNQVSALALGGDTYKLKFGHRGANQPVRHKDGRILHHHPEPWVCGGCRVTTGRVQVTYTNVNDGTVEGFENKDLEPHHRAVPPGSARRSAGYRIPFL